MCNLKAGATGFLPKNSTSQEHNIAFTSISKLAPRETEISELLMQGKWTNGISFILGLKPSTVSTLKAKIFEKPDVKNAVELFKKLEER